MALLMADGRRAVSVGQVWDLENGVGLRTLKGHDRDCSVSVTPDGRRAVSVDSNDKLQVWEKGVCLRTLGPGRHPLSIVHWFNSVSVTPDGCRAVSVGSDNKLRVWDLESGACLHKLVGYNGLDYNPWYGWRGRARASMTPDGRRVVSGERDNTLRVWDLESGACLRTLEGHSNGVRGVHVTPDGRRAVSESADNTLRVWDLESGTCLRTLEGHSGGVRGVHVTPDGRRAVSVSSDNKLRVWDLESGACLRTLEGCSDIVSVTSDGRRAISWSAGSTLCVWDLENGQYLGVFCTVVPVVATVSFSEKLVVELSTGEGLVVDMRNMPAGPGIVTATRFHSGPGRAGVRCPVCGTEFEPATEILSAIQSQLNCLPSPVLPESAFADKRLLSSCPHCAHPLKFNPFLVNASDATYEASIRRGLEHCRQTKGDDKDTIGHLAALAAHLEKMGISAGAAEFKREHDEMADRLEANLRRRLEHSRQTKFDDADTYCHLAALAGHLDTMGKSAEAAEFAKERDALRYRLRRMGIAVNENTYARDREIQDALPASLLPQKPREPTIEELREFADQTYRRCLWEAAASAYDKLLAAGDSLEEHGPKIVTCLLNTREIPMDADVKRIETILQQLEQTGHSDIAAPLRQQLQTKLPAPHKKWWKFW